MAGMNESPDNPERTVEELVAELEAMGLSHDEILRVVD
jgi:hypothetical protein